MGEPAWTDSKEVCDLRRFPQEKEKKKKKKRYHPKAFFLSLLFLQEFDLVFGQGSGAYNMFSSNSWTGIHFFWMCINWQSNITSFDASFLIFLLNFCQGLFKNSTGSFWKRFHGPDKSTAGAHLEYRSENSPTAGDCGSGEADSPNVILK